MSEAKPLTAEEEREVRRLGGSSASWDRIVATLDEERQKRESAEHLQRASESETACWQRALEEERRCRREVERHCAAMRGEIITACGGNGDVDDPLQLVRDAVRDLAVQTKRAEEAEAKLAQAERHHDEHHAREATMQPRCVSCDSEPNVCGPGCDCTHAPCRHDFNAACRDLATLREVATEYLMRSVADPNTGASAEDALRNALAAVAGKETERAP